MIRENLRTRAESANGDFPCAKLQNAKKNRQNYFLPIMKKPGIFIN